MIENLTTYLQANGLGTLGTNLFIGELPLNVDNCVSVMYSSSPDPNLTLEVYEQVIEFWSRNKSSRQCYEQLRLIKTLFERKHHYLMTDTYVYISSCLGLIDDYDVDIERRKLYKLSVRFVYRNNTLVS